MRAALCALAVLAFAVSAASTQARESVDRRLSAAGQPEVRRLSTVTPQPASATSWTLGHYTFDDSLGGPDPQGWTSHDVSPLDDDVFFHVDDFAGLAAPLSPLAGSQSMWCGARAEPPLTCSYATLPGYGNGWSQRFTSVPFPSAGDVTVTFLIRYDSETNYDFTHLQVWHTPGGWSTLASYHGTGESLESVVIPAASLPGAVQLRFDFESDAVWSDEDGLWSSDGAVIVDSLTVADDSLGTLDFQDFEGEAPGALATLDGDWSGEQDGFGDFAALFDGLTVLQEDSLVTNTTHLWGFFNGSPDTYACGGFPSQPAVPHTQATGSADADAYIDNQIRSPLIPLWMDVNGLFVPPTGSVVLEFDVYLDLPLDNLVMFYWQVRSFVDGCPGEWRNDFAYYDPGKLWQRQSFEMYPYIEPGATFIEVALGVVDMCPQLCGNLGTGNCHSHAPLFDNVTITARMPSDIVVTNTANDGAGSLRAAILAANASQDRNLIRFDIPGAGPHEIMPDTVLPRISWPVVLDATTQPGYAGTPLVSLRGDSAGTADGVEVDADHSVIRGLSIHGFQGNGITVTGKQDTIRSNYIGLTPGGVPAGNGGHGVDLNFQTRDALVGWSTQPGNPGGPVPPPGSPQHGNVIAHNGGDGVTHRSTAKNGNTIRGNSIYSNGELGIDIGNNGVTGNFLVLVNAWSAGNIIEGTFAGVLTADYVIDFFANEQCDSTGYGEGERLLGSIAVTTDGGGNAAFNTVLPESLLAGEYVTATVTDEPGNTSEFSQCVTVQGTASGIPRSPALPQQVALYPNIPNPFNPVTTIPFDVPAGGAEVRLVVYDVAGRHVRTLVNDFVAQGRRSATWDGRNERGGRVSTGVYFARIDARGITRTQKMMVIK